MRRRAGDCDLALDATALQAHLVATLRLDIGVQRRRGACAAPPAAAGGAGAAPADADAASGSASARLVSSLAQRVSCEACGAVRQPAAPVCLVCGAAPTPRTAACKPAPPAPPTLAQRRGLVAAPTAAPELSAAEWADVEARAAARAHGGGECAVCLQPLALRAAALTSCCAALLHSACMDALARHAGRGTGVLRCPLCRAAYALRRSRAGARLHIVAAAVIVQAAVRSLLARRRLQALRRQRWLAAAGTGTASAALSDVGDLSPRRCAELLRQRARWARSELDLLWRRDAREQAARDAALERALQASEAGLAALRAAATASATPPPAPTTTLAPRALERGQAAAMAATRPPPVHVSQQAPLAMAEAHPRHVSAQDVNWPAVIDLALRRAGLDRLVTALPPTASSCRLVDDEARCPICMQEMASRLSILSCAHTYHDTCIAALERFEGCADGLAAPPPTLAVAAAGGRTVVAAGWRLAAAAPPAVTRCPVCRGQYTRIVEA